MCTTLQIFFTEGCVRMGDNELRKRVLGGKKTERLVFAVTPEMKAAMERIAEEECTSVSAMLTAFAAEKVLAHKSLFE